MFLLSTWLCCRAGASVLSRAGCGAPRSQSARSRSSRLWSTRSWSSRSRSSRSRSHPRAAPGGACLVPLCRGWMQSAARAQHEGRARHYRGNGSRGVGFCPSFWKLLWCFSIGCRCLEGWSSFCSPKPSAPCGGVLSILPSEQQEHRAPGRAWCGCTLGCRVQSWAPPDWAILTSQKEIREEQQKGLRGWGDWFIRKD